MRRAGPIRPALFVSGEVGISASMGWSPGGVKRPQRPGARRKEADLPATHEAPSLARGVVRDALIDVLPTEFVHEATLLASEITTNAVQHGDGEMLHLVVDVDKASGCVQVAVQNPGPGFDPSSLNHKGDPEHGRGLRIVEALAERWGVERGPPTVVWFEVSLKRK
jgi:anti-sigma regulatory factor (Ser/Thr protein kinase)